MNCAPFTADASLSNTPCHRYGACCAASALVPFAVKIMIFLAAISAVNTVPAPVVWLLTSTANGFIAATASASARCASSLGPVGLKTVASIVRPQVWNDRVKTVSQSAAASST